jgi:hypothetical protein
MVVRLASMCCSAWLGKRCTHVSDFLGSGGEIIRGEFKPRKSFSLSEIHIDVDVKKHA